jgi:hypothetical protein
MERQTFKSANWPGRIGLALWRGNWRELRDLQKQRHVTVPENVPLFMLHTTCRLALLVCAFVLEVLSTDVAI